MAVNFNSYNNMYEKSAFQNFIRSGENSTDTFENPVIKKRKIDKNEQEEYIDGAFAMIKKFEKSLLSLDSDASGVVFMDFEPFQKIYSQISVEHKRNILDYLLERHELRPLSKALKVGNVRSLVPFEDLEISTKNFLVDYLLPAVQKYLAEVFEIERTEALFKAARACKDYVDNHVFLSDNHINRYGATLKYIDSKESGLCAFDEDSKKLQLKHIRKEVKNNYMGLRSQARVFCSIPQIKSELVYAFIGHQVLERYHLANCGDISRAGLYFITNRFPFKAEVFTIEGSGMTIGDHEVLVLNRKNGSDPKNFKTWGRICLVVDNWIGKEKEIYYAHEIPIYLENYLGEIDKATLLPLTEKFDPKKHFLSSIVTNRYSAADFRQLSVQKADKITMDWLADLLSDFEEETSLEKKQEIAQKIIKAKFPFTEKTNHDLFRELKAQMRLFLNPAYSKVYQLSAQPKKGISAFEALAYSSDVNLDENFISRVLIEHLCKIAVLLLIDSTHAANRKLSALSTDTKASIAPYLCKNLSIECPNNWILKSKAIVQDHLTNQQKADAIYSFLQAKIEMAAQAGRKKTAYQILSLLPVPVQERIKCALETSQG